MSDMLSSGHRWWSKLLSNKINLCHRHRYSVTEDAGKGHLVLGKVDKYSVLTTEESAAFLALCPHAIVDRSIVFDRLLLDGIVYTNYRYQQKQSNDYIIAFKNGSIGKACKYISITSQDMHVVLIHEMITTSSQLCNHIKLVTAESTWVY